MNEKEYIIFPTVNYGKMEIQYASEGFNPETCLFIYTSEYVQSNNPQGTFIIDDFSDNQVIIRKIEEWRLAQTTPIIFTSVIAIDDNRQFDLSNSIAQQFNIPFYQPKTLLIAANKFFMKQAFKEQGVPTGSFSIIRSSEDSVIESIGFPNVLKVLVGNGSEYLFINKSQDELTRNFKTVQNTLTEEKKNVDLLIEEYIPGKEYSLDFMLENGKISILRVVRKFNSQHAGYFSGFYLMNKASIRKRGLSLRHLENVCAKVASALEVEKGVFMVDFKVDRGEVKVIETNIRPGFSSFVPLMQKVYGYTSFNVVYALASKKELPKELVFIPDDEGLVVNFFAHQGGRIREFSLADMEQEGCIGRYCYNEVGEFVVDSVTSHHDLLLGFMLIKNPEKGNIEKLVHQITEKANIKVTQEATIVNKMANTKVTI